MNRRLPFLIALQFLTRIPVRLPCTPDEQATGKSILYYPLIGLIIGMLFGTIWYLTAPLSETLRAAILLCCWTLITGGLHLDGLADTADALVGGHGQKDQTLKIMKDPRSGPIAVITLVCILLLQYSALQSINNLPLLILIPVIARSQILLLFSSTDYVREQGLGSALKNYLPQKSVYPILIGISLVIIMFGGSAGIWLLISNLVIFHFWRRLFVKIIGGFSGDVAGALVVLSETVSLLIVAIAS